MSTKTPIAITTLDLRRNIPQVRKALQKGQSYVLLYRGKPIGEITAVSDATQDMFFTASQTLNPDAVRIKKNVQQRKQKRILKNKTR